MIRKKEERNEARKEEIREGRKDGGKERKKKKAYSAVIMHVRHIRASYYVTLHETIISIIG